MTTEVQLDYHAPRPVAPRPSPLKSVNNSQGATSSLPFFRSSTGSVKRAAIPTCLHRLRNSQDVAAHAEEELESILYSASNRSNSHNNLLYLSGESSPVHETTIGFRVEERPQTPSPRTERKLGLQLLGSSGVEEQQQRRGVSSSGRRRDSSSWRSISLDGDTSNSLSPLFQVYTPPISRASNPIVSDNRFHFSQHERTSRGPPQGAELGLLSVSPPRRRRGGKKSWQLSK